VQGDTVLLLLNGGSAPAHFRLPPQEKPGNWMLLIDTSSETHMLSSREATDVTLEPYSLMLFRFGEDRRVLRASAASAASGSRAGTELAEGGDPR
jgi:hypothetical protein